MGSYYYSNWNRNNRASELKKIALAVLKFPFKLMQKFSLSSFGFKKAAKWVLYLGAFLLLAGSVVFAIVSLSLPDPNKLMTRVVPQSTKIYARDESTLLYEIHGEAKRTLVELSDIPDHAKNATIAIEDKDFYKNPGFSWRGIFRSVFTNLKQGDLTGQGGSTITQQFVKNAILTREKTYTRKVKEIVLAIELQQRFSKNDILKMYLNEIPYGQNAYGIEAAAQTYFGKHARDLNLAESAYLAALPQRPTYYSPTGPHRDKLDERKNVVLDEMYRQGYITLQQRDTAKNEKVTFNKIRDSIFAPHFVMYVQNLLAEKYGEKTLEEGGLRVVTTLDYKMQQIAEQAVKDGVERNEKRNKANDAALVAIDPKTGQILAMVGSPDYFNQDKDGQVNASLSSLQPGSSIKPYIYATAFKQGMAPATMLVDVRTVFGTYGGKEYAPANYNGQNNGILSMRKALAGSLNVPAVKTLSLVGVQNAIDTMKDMGITSDISPDRCGLSLVLGGCEISLLDHTSAMGVFANGGIRHEKTPILKVMDGKGKILEEYRDDAGQEAIDPQVAYEIANIMTDNDARTYVFGSKSPLILPDRVVAAKTGTTQSWKDGWTMGYTPSLSVGVWTGNFDGTPMRQGADGVVTAAPIWNQFMREALKGTPPEQFLEPSGIQHIYVDSVSGKLPTEYTPQTKSEVFASFAIPKDFDDVHVPVRINRLNGKRATDQTPPDLIETRVYTVIHSERPNDPNWEGPVVAWARAAGYSYPPADMDDGSVSPISTAGTQVQFVSPSNNQEVRSVPFNTQVSVTGQTPQSVEMYLEGEYQGSRSQAPYIFSIDPTKSGWQTLMTIVRLPNGDSIQNSIRVNIANQ